MKLVFSLEYRTDWGQDLRAEVTLKRKRGADVRRVYPLHTDDGLNWTGEALVTEKDIERFTYRYAVYEGELVFRQEWDGVPRDFPAADRNFVLSDYWKDIPSLQHLYSSAYLNCITHTQAQKTDLVYFPRTLVFRVQAPQLKEHQSLGLLGSLPSLGAWMPERPLAMSRAGAHEWIISLNAEYLASHFEYKYVIVDEKSGEVISWEEGENRSYDIREKTGDILVVWDRRIRVREEHWKAAGVVIPVFSLRSEKSQGVGDFGDLKRMVDWAAKAGLRCIQVLPVNDTQQSHTWQDCYPYNAISIFALHPQYVDLSQLPAVLDGEYMTRYERERVRLNNLPQEDYEGVERLKSEYLRRLYEQEGEAAMLSAAYQNFFKANEDWLIPYAVFCHRRDADGTSCYRDWKELAEYEEKKVYRYFEANKKEVNYYVWVQYLLDQQLSQASRYARRQGVILKGDIPIGISRTSVEAWSQPELFNLEGSAGAPPDDFSKDGQNWGFPTYNWEAMHQTGYRWWIRRFKKMAEYFDAYRIDHVLGFFRIWQVPVNCPTALLGQFVPALPMTVEEIESYGMAFHPQLFVEDYRRKGLYHPRISVKDDPNYQQLPPQERQAFDRLHEQYFYHRHNDFWGAEAMKKLPALLEATQMLVCAEDLGMVPECVGPVMDRLRMLSLEIQAMPKALGVRFGRLEENPYRSVATIFTHDMPTLRQWWEEDPERSQAYWNEALHKDGHAPQTMEGWLAEEIVSRHLFCPSMLCLISLQDWLAMDETLRLADPNGERINIPAVARHYWRYRMHLSIEQLQKADNFNRKVKDMVERSGRQ